MALFSTLGGLFWIFVVIASILAIFVPFFIFRIRNEIITTNKLIRTMIYLLEQQKVDLATSQDVEDIEPKVDLNNSGPPLIVCRSCGAKNRLNDTICSRCGQGIV